MKALLLLCAVAAAGCASEPSAAVRAPAPKTSAEGDTAGDSRVLSLDPSSDSSTTTTEVPATTTTVEPTTTTEPAPATTVAVRRPAPTTVYEPPSPQSRTTGRGNEPPAGDAPLACIRSYEQGAGGYATDTGNGYYGAYQFDLTTWRSVGGSGLPSDASPAEQDMRAQMLYDSRGLAPWPTPNRMCR